MKLYAYRQSDGKFVIGPLGCFIATFLVGFFAAVTIAGLFAGWTLAWFIIHAIFG